MALCLFGVFWHFDLRIKSRKQFIHVLLLSHMSHRFCVGCHMLGGRKHSLPLPIDWRLVHLDACYILSWILWSACLSNWWSDDRCKVTTGKLKPTTEDISQRLGKHQYFCVSYSDSNSTASWSKEVLKHAGGMWWSRQMRCRQFPSRSTLVSVRVWYPKIGILHIWRSCAFIQYTCTSFFTIRLYLNGHNRLFNLGSHVYSKSSSLARSISARGHRRDDQCGSSVIFEHLECTGRAHCPPPCRDAWNDLVTW